MVVVVVVAAVVVVVLVVYEYFISLEVNLQLPSLLHLPTYLSSHLMSWTRFYLPETPAALNSLCKIPKVLYIVRDPQAIASIHNAYSLLTF